MDFTTLPTDILHSIVLGLPIEQQGLLCLNKSLESRIYNNNGFWYRRYLQDFGHDMMFDDCPKVGWKRRYMTRHGIYSVHCRGIRDNIRARNVTSDGCELITIGMDRMVFDHYHVPDAIDICIAHDNIYVLNADGTILHLDVYHHQTIRVNGWPRAKQMVPYLSNLFLITMDDRVYITRVGEGEYTNIRAKYMSLSEGMGAYIDVDDNIWYTTAVGLDDTHPEMKSDVWRPFFGMKGRRVTCGDGSMIIIDLDGNLWSFGERNLRGRLGVDHELSVDEPHMIEGIKGLDVHMDHLMTWIIDIYHNLWEIGGIHRTGEVKKRENFKVLDAHLGYYHRALIGTTIQG